MKKHILAIILCVLCVSLVLVFASCGDTNTSTDCSQGHSFGDWTTETYASCTSAGLKVRVCQNCSYEEEEPIPSGHKWGEWEVIKELTCEQNGLDQRICSVCDFVEEEEFTTEGHKWSEWEITVVGSCNDDSLSERECSACGKKEEETVPGDGHNFSEWGTDLVGDPFIKNATCEETGYIGRECIDCGEQEFQTTDALGHTWGAWDVVGSCATGATKTRVCSVCNDDETETTAAGEHANIVFEGAKEATRDEDGSTGIKKCLSCGETLASAKIVRISNIASLSTVTSNAGHWQVVGNEAGWAPNTLPYLIDGKHNTGTPTCAQTAGTQWFLLTFEDTVVLNEFVLVCNGSGNIGYLGNKENTNFKVDVTVTFYDENDNVLLSETKNTENVIALTFNTDFEETVKKIKISYPTSYSAATLYLWEAEAYAIEYLDPCEADGHNWGDGWKTVTSATCSPDSLTDGLETRTCSVCGKTEQNVILAKHTWTEWNMTGITCAGGGTKTRECRDCGKSVSETIAAGGHLNIELQGVSAPTLEAEGYTGDYVCTACGVTVEAGKAIPKLVNVALDATPSTNSTNWPIVGNGSNWAPNTIPNINDGNLATGANTNDWHLQTIDYILTWDSPVSVNEIIYVCNGTGNFGYDGNFENTNWEVDYVITVYDENGNTIVTAKGNTKDQTQIKVEIPEGSALVKKVVLNINHRKNNVRGGVFEIMAIADGQNVENEAE